MSIYDLREGAFGTVNTWTALTGKGSGGTVNAMTVPAGMNSIRELWVTFCEPVPADSAGGLICVKLTGTGLKFGEQKFLVGGLGREETSNNAYSDGMLPVKLKVAVATNPGGEIWAWAAQYGTDMGTPEAAVQPVWSSEAAPERYYVIRMAACGTLDADTALSADVSDTPGVIQVPGHLKHIYSITTATGGVYLATATGGTSFVRLRGALKSGELVICAGAHGALSTTTGVSGGYSFAVQVPTMVEITGGGQISAYGDQSGVDWGTPYIGVGVELGV